jgi:hypothetical protein
MRGEMLVSRWIPHFVVHAVRDTDEPITSRAQKPFEAVTVFRVLNFERVATADSRKHVACHQSRLQSGSRAVR